MKNNLVISFCLMTAVSVHIIESRADSTIDSERDYANKRLLLMDKMFRSKTTAEIISLQGQPLNIYTVDKRLEKETEAFSPLQIEEQCKAEKYLVYRLTENRDVAVFIKNGKCTCVKESMRQMQTKSTPFKAAPSGILQTMQLHQGSTKGTVSD